MDILEQILKHAEYKANDIIKKKYGKSPQIKVSQLIIVVLEFKRLKDVGEKFGIHRHKISSMLKTVFPNKIGQDWSLYLMSLTNYKICIDCGETKYRIEFSKNSLKTDGLKFTCKQCDKGYYKEYYENNKDVLNAKGAERRAAKINRTPSWADLKKIKEIYTTCPEDYHVDHIYPLQGKLVSGLHVHNNLQHLTAAENLAKSNKYEII